MSTDRTETPKEDREYVAGLEKGLAVIEAFGVRRPRLTLSEAAELTGLSVAAARRCLRTLGKLGYATFDGKYFRLAPRTLRLGNAFLASSPLLKTEQPVLESISERTHESASLAILDDTEAVFIARSTTRRSLSVGVGVGTRLPAYCAATGRVLLSGLPDAEAKAVLARTSLRKLTPRTLTEPAELLFAITPLARASRMPLHNRFTIDCGTSWPLTDPDPAALASFMQSGREGNSYPSSSLAEAFTAYCHKLRVDKETGKKKFAIIQAEDELASIGIVTGAGWNGARAFTATSGPGISLMSEFIGLAYFAEIPVTIIDVQRGGPSTGMPTRTQQSDVTMCAYASHGDTKHILLFPEDPHECFELSAQALDLADRLQTPVFVMTDLDIGMNQRLSQPFKWQEGRTYDRGKVMTAEELEAGKEFARYLDVDGDGIPYRTLPGTHPTKGAYFTRGTSRNPYAVYSEAGPDYQYNMQRLLKKHEFAKTLLPKPVLTPSKEPARFGCIYYGSTSPAMHEALDSLAARGIFVNALRVRAFPFADEIQDFVQSHSKVFVVEQNRDAQLKTMLVNEAGINPLSLISVLHYDGTPITARFITKEISEIVSTLNVRPIKRDKAA